MWRSQIHSNINRILSSWNISSWFLSSETHIWHYVWESKQRHSSYRDNSPEIWKILDYVKSYVEEKNSTQDGLSSHVPASSTSRNNMKITKVLNICKCLADCVYTILLQLHTQSADGSSWVDTEYEFASECEYQSMQCWTSIPQPQEYG